MKDNMSATAVFTNNNNNNQSELCGDKFVFYVHVCDIKIVATISWFEIIYFIFPHMSWGFGSNLDLWIIQVRTWHQNSHVTSAV